VKGVVNPPVHFPKKGSQSKLPHDESGDKVIVHQIKNNGEASDLGLAPAHRRIYMRDYSKVRPSPDDTDLVTAELGNPLKW